MGTGICLTLLLKAQASGPIPLAVSGYIKRFMVSAIRLYLFGVIRNFILF